MLPTCRTGHSTPKQHYCTPGASAQYETETGHCFNLIDMGCGASLATSVQVGAMLLQVLLRAIRPTKLRTPASVFSSRVRPARDLRRPNQPVGGGGDLGVVLAAHPVVPAGHEMPQLQEHRPGLRRSFAGQPLQNRQQYPAQVGQGILLDASDVPSHGVLSVYGARLAIQSRRVQGRPVDGIVVGRQDPRPALGQTREPVAPVEASRGRSGAGPAARPWGPGPRPPVAFRPRWTTMSRPLPATSAGGHPPARPVTG